MLMIVKLKSLSLNSKLSVLVALISLMNACIRQKITPFQKINEETHKIPSFFYIYPPNNARRDWAITIFFSLFHLNKEVMNQYFRNGYFLKHT